jgi:hypothetical protein
LKVVDVRDVVLQLLAMMMESVNNITMERKVRFSLMVENPNINTMDKNVKFALKVFYFSSRPTTTLLLRYTLSSLHCFVFNPKPKKNKLCQEFVF